MKKGVLVIDDDLNTCQELKTMLENEEIEVYYTLSVSEALCLFMKWNFCLVIMDIRLPENNGCEVLRVMRQTKDIPMAFVSRAHLRDLPPNCVSGTTGRIKER